MNKGVEFDLFAKGRKGKAESRQLAKRLEGYRPQ